MYRCKFRLNEGHTVFIERKIAGRMKGEQFRHFEVIGGWADLVYQVSMSLHSYFTFNSPIFYCPSLDIHTQLAFLHQLNITHGLGILSITQACLCRLNEGHTKFIERMVVSRVRTKDNTEPFRHFLAIDGLRALSYQVG